MIKRYRYTVYIDDSSKLCGYIAQLFEGNATTIKGNVMTIASEGVPEFSGINWERVRWYTCELIKADSGAATPSTDET